MILLFISLLVFSALADTPFTCNAEYDDLNITRQETNSIEHFYYCFRISSWKRPELGNGLLSEVQLQGRNSEVLGFKQLESGSHDE